MIICHGETDYSGKLLLGKTFGYVKNDSLTGTIKVANLSWENQANKSEIKTNLNLLRINVNKNKNPNETNKQTTIWSISEEEVKKKYDLDLKSYRAVSINTEGTFVLMFHSPLGKFSRGLTIEGLMIMDLEIEEKYKSFEVINSKNYSFFGPHSGSIITYFNVRSINDNKFALHGINRSDTDHIFLFKFFINGTLNESNQSMIVWETPTIFR